MTLRRAYFGDVCTGVDVLGSSRMDDLTKMQRVDMLYGTMFGGAKDGKD